MPILWGLKTFLMTSKSDFTLTNMMGKLFVNIFEQLTFAIMVKFGHFYSFFHAGLKSGQFWD